jgi:hypothetical protein
LAEISLRIAAEALAKGAGVAASFQTGTKGLPSRKVSGSKFPALEATAACAQAGDDANGPTQDQTRRGGLATGAPSLMVTGRAKQLFQIIVGPRQIGNVITVEQSRPVTVGDFQEMGDGGLELPGVLRPSTHVTQENAVSPTNRRTAMLLWIIENVCGSMNKAESGSHWRP